MLRGSWRPYAIWLRASIIGSLFIIGYLTFFPEKSHITYSTLISSNTCGNTSRGANIVVSVKTGASEATDRIPTQLRTTLRCVQNIVIFSDLEQDIGDHHIYDSLDTVLPSVMESNSDFDFYTKQKELWLNSHDISSMKNAKNPAAPEELAAWTLDKYKNVHIVEKTWVLKPDMDWYIFIDADTYIIWPNLLTWLSTLDPRKKSYFGSEVSMTGTRFAHGGSGIILSNAAVAALVRNNGSAASWDYKISEHCCGDLVLGMALKELGTELQDVWPTMSGEAPETMPFGPGTLDYWCRPALTMHHLTPADMEKFTNFEQGRQGKQTPLTHMEIFKDFLANDLRPERLAWDNVASDRGEFGKTGGVLVETATTFEDCTRACEANEDCFQYSQHGQTCNLGMSVRAGSPKQADHDGAWRSGWNLTRLAQWSSKQPECNGVSFPVQGA